MAVFAANVTTETLGLIEDLLNTDEFVKFRIHNRLNLSDNTILIRLALINLKRNMPSSEQVAEYKAALIRPSEFENFWQEELGVRASVP